MYNDVLNFIGFMNGHKIICNIADVNRQDLAKKLKEDHVKNADAVSISTGSYIFMQNETVFCEEEWRDAVDGILDALPFQENRLCILTYRLHYVNGINKYYVTAD